MMKAKLLKCLFLFSAILVSSQLSAQTKVHGIVTDNDSQPLIGVTVAETGTSMSNVTITDVDGHFEIIIKDLESASLSLSYIGFQNKDVQLKGRSKVDITLESDVSELDGVVVIGYGTSSKSDLTGAVTSLRSQSLEDDNSASLTGMLIGRIPGVHAVSTGGAPGAKTNIIIRGASSVSGGTSPLYVVDGVMMGGSSNEVSAAGRVGDSSLDPLSLINPEDIASMTVLKDASATAIYGSRGANGVIIVTTKSGSLNQTPQVSISYDFAVDAKPKQIEMLNGYDYENYLCLRYPWEPDNLSNSGSWNPDGTVKHSGKNNNWQDQILRPAFTHNVNASVRGGSKNTSYAITAGYLDKDGIALGSSMNRFTFGGKLDVTVNKWFKVGLDLKGSQSVNNGIVSADRFVANNVFAQMLIYSPINDIDEVSDDLTDGNNPRNNPIVNAQKAVQRNETSRIQGNGYVEFTFLKGFTLKSSFGGYINGTKSKNFYPNDVGYGYTTNGSAIHANQRVKNWLNENILSFNRTINKTHTVMLCSDLHLSSIL